MNVKRNTRLIVRELERNTSQGFEVFDSVEEFTEFFAKPPEKTKAQRLKNRLFKRSFASKANRQTP